MNNFELLQPGTIATLFSHTATAGITSLANNANVLSAAAVTPPTDAGEADWELLFTPAASLSAGVTVSLYLVPTLDGTNYANGTTSADPAAALLAGVWVCASGAGQQRLIIRSVPFPATPFKALLSNETGQAFNSAQTHTVKYRPVKRAIVGS